jgi:hypothetical protein
LTFKLTPLIGPEKLHTNFKPSMDILDSLAACCLNEFKNTSGLNNSDKSNSCSKNFDVDSTEEHHLSSALKRSIIAVR